MVLSWLKTDLNLDPSHVVTPVQTKHGKEKKVTDKEKTLGPFRPTVVLGASWWSARVILNLPSVLVI